MGRVGGTGRGVTPSEASRLTTALPTFVLGVGKVSFPCLLSVNEKRPNQAPVTREKKGICGGGQGPAWALRGPGVGWGDSVPHARGPFSVCISGEGTESPEKECVSGPSSSSQGLVLPPIRILQTHRKL